MRECSNIGMDMISIHAPRTGSDLIGGIWRDADAISIHAPRTGSDKQHKEKADAVWLFQSTLPARGATTALTS